MEFLKLAQARRSVRSFADTPLTDAQVSQLLAAAIAAPSAGNRQAWYFYVVRDAKLRADLANRATTQSFIAEAPVVIAVCADPSQNAARYAERGATLYTTQDTAAAIQNILLAAHAMDLGACWCGGFDEGRAAEILDLPAHLRPVALIPVGHPAGPAPEATPRRPLGEVVTYL